MKRGPGAVMVEEVGVAGTEMLCLLSSMEKGLSKPHVGRLGSFPCRLPSEMRSSRVLLYWQLSLQSNWARVTRSLFCLLYQLLLVSIDNFVRVLVCGNESDIVNLRPSFL